MILDVNQHDVDQHAIDQHTKARYRAATARLSARTMAELHRRRIAACDRQRTPRWRRWPLASVLGSACALALALALLLPSTTPLQYAFDVVAELDSTDAQDALDTINLTALDEDSEFFLWLATHEASLLAME